MVIDCAGGAYLLALGDVCQLDAVVIVVEPYPRSAEVARRLLETMSDKGCSARVLVVANKIGTDEDLDAVRRLLPEVQIDVTVPLDSGVTDADVQGRALTDVAPSGPAATAIGGLAKMLVFGAQRPVARRGT